MAFRLPVQNDFVIAELPAGGAATLTWSPGLLGSGLRHAATPCYVAMTAKGPVVTGDGLIRITQSE